MKNTAIYQPYGQFYFLYETADQPSLVKADTLTEKKTIMTLPVTTDSLSLTLAPTLSLTHIAVFNR